MPSRHKRLASIRAQVHGARNGQLDDLDGAALRVLTDDDLVEEGPR
jgi:nitrogen fixation-related uncharacterized protein